MSSVVEVNLTGSISQKMNPAFRPLVSNKDRIQVLVGGASSSKSFSTAQKLLYKVMAEDGHKVLVVRKVAATLRHSCFDLLLAIMADWNMRALFKIMQTDLSMKCLVNGNEILFTGLDDVERLKSIHGVTDIWIEEASEITEADFNQLDLRLRGETKHKKQITLTLNPISAQHWIKKRFWDRQEDSALTHHSTYKDNRHIDADTIRRLEGITDPYFRDVYVLGKWGIFANAVFTNYVIEDFPYGEDDLENVSQGMDFGYAHASALERVGFRDGELYVFDELYGKGWTNRDFIRYMGEYFGDKAFQWPITADSAEPDRIEEWYREGYTGVTPAKKGAGSLRFGIDYLCNRRIHIHATRCPHFIAEIQQFKRREDKDGNAIDQFVELNDDTIAAVRYATEYIWSNAGSTWAPSEYSASDLGL
jgi:phage terminase large subunit